MENLVDHIKRYVESKEKSFDNWLLLHHPELWRRGYARVLKYGVITVAASFPILFFLLFLYLLLVNKNIIQNTDGALSIIFIILPFIIIFVFLRGIYLLFEKDDRIVARSKSGFADLGFVLNPKSERWILGINLGFVIFSHLYVVILYALVILTISPFVSKEEKSSVPSLSSLEADIQNVIKGEYYYLTTYGKLPKDTAAQIIKDSIVSALDTSLSNRIKSQFISECIDSLTLKDSLLIITSYFASVHSEYPNYTNDFSPHRKSYKEIVNLLNERHIPDDLNTLERVIKTIIGIYLLVLAWGLTYFYFKDTRALGYRLRLPQTVLWSRTFLYWYLRVIIYGGMAIVIGFLLGFMLSASESVHSTIAGNIFDYLYIALLYWWEVVSITGVTLFYAIIPIFLILYFLFFPKWKYQTYQYYANPATHRLNSSPTRVTPKPQRTSFSLMRFKIHSTVDDYLLKYFPELWRRNIIRLLGVAIKNMIFLTYFAFFATILLILFWEKGIISARGFRIMIGIINQTIYIFTPAILLFSGKLIKSRTDGVTKEIRFLFNWRSERLLIITILVFCIGIVFSIILLKNVIFNTYLFLSDEKLKKEDFYFYAIESMTQSTVVAFEFPYAIKAEYYFQKKYDELDDKVIIDNLSRSVSSRIDTTFYEFASGRKIAKVIEEFNMEDSTRIITIYNSRLTDKPVTRLSDSTNLLTYRKNFDTTVMDNILTSIKYEEESTKHVSKIVLYIYYYILFFLGSIIYFFDLFERDFKMNFLNKSHLTWAFFRSNWKAFALLLSILAMMIFLKNTFFLGLILFALIFYPKIKYEIYKYNYAPK